ncbi:MAG: Uma2 family endonuclease [Desulfobacterales bacterium]|nr:Uma2 family endonuclease [Desulfobacterales bacterium]
MIHTFFYYMVQLILSPGTESFDRGKKFEYYRTIKTLKEYVLISQDKPMIEIYFRQDKNTWLYSVARGIDSTIVFQSLEYEIALKDIYRKVLLSES